MVHSFHDLTDFNFLLGEVNNGHEGITKRSKNVRADESDR